MSAVEDGHLQTALGQALPASFLQGMSLRAKKVPKIPKKVFTRLDFCVILVRLA